MNTALVPSFPGDALPALLTDITPRDVYKIKGSLSDKKEERIAIWLCRHASD
jgi:hypothetical protein